MKKILFVVVIVICTISFSPDWGFFGHRTINEYACYTLPQRLFSFYKPHIKYVSKHAVDPDMRRYAVKKEAGRHYIDIDYWGEAPFDILPRSWAPAFNKMLVVNYENTAGDTITLKECRVDGNAAMDSIFNRKILKDYFNDDWKYTCEDITAAFPNITDCASAFVHDSLTDYGILPYNLVYTYRRLINAYDTKDVKRILKYAADIGHYVGDAHVPLHTTINYNGQLTDQVGIHAFWESRLPELFAMDQYDFMVGQARYVPNIERYSWEIVLDTHTYLDSVLLIEERLRRTYPSDLQNCYEQRLERTVRVECEAFAKAYHEGLDGMVEEQMMKAVSALGDIWYSAWIDAGQPILTDDVPYVIEVDTLNINQEYQNEIHH